MTPRLMCVFLGHKWSAWSASKWKMGPPGIIQETRERHCRRCPTGQQQCATWSPGEVRAFKAAPFAVLTLQETTSIWESSIGEEQDPWKSVGQKYGFDPEYASLGPDGEVWLRPQL
jgi:hypothetical protein